MRPYLALMRIDFKLAMRDRSVLFFNYLFPLIFFFVFAEMMGVNRGGGVANVVTMVLTIGILGNGLWGAGMRAVQEREMNILRRFKVTPISPAPILIASMVTGWLIYLPAVFLVITLAHRIYGMPRPSNWFSLLALITLGVFAFRSIGLILASIVNSTQESTIGIQLLYMPMLFLSGATFPTVMLPAWAQIVGQFLPATYLVTGFQSVFLRHETLAQNWPAVGALLATMVLATFISVQIFRWEKDEKLRPAAKLWVLAVLSPFLVMGCYQAYSNDHKLKAELLWRELMRNDTFLIRGARIFVGPGKVIDSGAVLMKQGKISEVYEGAAGTDQIKADIVEAAGKTLLPGLIDMHVHLGSPGGTYDSPQEYSRPDAMTRELAAYLYSGVTAVRGVGDFLDQSLEARGTIASGKRLGAELYACGPMFTAEHGHGTEYIDYMPELLKARAREQMVRTPKTPGEARQQVRALKQAGGDCVKAILEAGWTGRSFPRLDAAILKAIGEEARAQKLPLIVHTGNSRDVADALDAGANGIEHGSFADEIPDALFARMVQAGVTYDPTLSVMNALSRSREGKLQLLSRSLVLQVGPANLIESTKRAVEKEKERPGMEKSFERARQNLLRAHRAGVILIAGSDAGNSLVIHGPTVQQELELWVVAGIPPAVALQAATYNAAKALRAADRIGSIEVGHDANLLLVDGDPLSDISVTERISLVVFKGERIRRSALFEQK